MKRTASPSRPHGGFTVPEMMVGIGVLGLLGGVFFSVLNSGMILFAKNTAVNVAHEETRQGINRLTRDIHAAISIPQLRDLNSVVVDAQPAASPSPTPICAAAVSFQNIAGGPHQVWQDPGSASLIKIKDFGVKPEDGMRMIVPFWGLEDNITKTAANGSMNHTNVFLEKGWPGTRLPRPEGGASAIIYYTDRVMYKVQNGKFIKDPDGDYTTKDGSNSNASVSDPNNWKFLAVIVKNNDKAYRYEGGELHMYKQRYTNGTLGWKAIAVVARNLTTPLPFSVPLNSGGTANTKYVAVKLAASDPKSSNRSYKATNSLLDTQVDYRAAITISQ